MPLTKFRMYESAKRQQAQSVRGTRFTTVEPPWCVTGTSQLTGLQKRPTDRCTDRFIGTWKVDDAKGQHPLKRWLGSHNQSLHPWDCWHSTDETGIITSGGIASSQYDGTDGTPCEVKVSRTVWVGGKSRDDVKGWPIDMGKDKHTLSHSLIRILVAAWSGT